LALRLAARIAVAGPITVADYMEACLHDPADGYYATRPDLGEAGDFITAPHVSQMFGELLGAWAAEIWTQMGAPTRVRLVELGPGDGTMMSDVLRAARAAPGFIEAIELVLLETSAPLRARQAETLPRAFWISDLGELETDAPVIVLANEFLDCLPIRQAVKCADGWRERRVGLDRSGGLAFVLGDSLPEIDWDGDQDAVIEWSPELTAAGARIGDLLAQAGGAALLFDYGRDQPGPSGDTLQALRAHRKEHPLASPGVADLTAHADFPTFLSTAAVLGASTHPLANQGAFLRALGIEARAATLARANPSEAAKIGRQVQRLVAPEQMGELFKVACVSSPGLQPPGFA
jgi:SAM-dependent MidA family methyltransferase